MMASECSDFLHITIHNKYEHNDAVIIYIVVKLPSLGCHVIIPANQDSSKLWRWCEASRQRVCGETKLRYDA